MFFIPDILYCSKMSVSVLIGTLTVILVLILTLRKWKNAHVQIFCPSPHVACQSIIVEENVNGNLQFAFINNFKTWYLKRMVLNLWLRVAKWITLRWQGIEIM